MRNRKKLIPPLQQIPLQQFQPNYLKIVNPIIGYINVMIKQRGQRAFLYHSVPCPCTGVSETGGVGYPAPDCISCGGSGIYFLHNEPRLMRALLSNMGTEERDVKGGFVLTGRVNITVPEDMRGTVSPGDKFVFPDISAVVSLVRRYDASLGGIKVPFDVIGIEHIVIKMPDPKSLAIMLEETKYGINREKKMVYVRDERLGDGMAVSMTILVVPEYIVDTVESGFRQYLTSTSDADASIVKFPRRFTGVRADLYLGSIPDHTEVQP